MLAGRLRDIVNRVDHLGSVGVAELAAQFNVAVGTIRRDLRALEDAGYLQRTHGGASSIADGYGASLALSSREQANAAAKQRIASQAAAMVLPGDVLMLDHSSSSLYLAQELPDIEITVITNLVKTVFDLVCKPNIRVISIGGEYSEKYGAFVGAIAVNNVLEFRADICFFSSLAFQPEVGAWDSNEINASVKKAMLRNSRSNVLLCDTSKFNRTAFSLLAPADRIHCIITEDKVIGDVHRLPGTRTESSRMSDLVSGDNNG